ncbi:zonular occludens toxin domain-containing protein [Marinobacterium iners]|uniref:Zona occludens toxin n=1 Tax=Marinobacterium iners DSM 11526 TaxID=1122198 RepID=A0A1H4H841_9GAMM|nr:zonular occludens toxin domain-containing protein [Marinobacterium iners]SEB17954.1 zona occludens toxin [Marinobacterium iners DSM 11526]
MSISIHHGANGSFKTAGVISDYFIPAAKAGRVVVTNIRGVSRERTFLHMQDVPDSFDVVFIDTDTRQGRYQMATWFHWAPLGALCLFDESGVMFPKAWRQKDLDALDYPGGPDQASIDGRPANWIEAWEMHRHFNWDIVLTAPNIKSIRDDIRQTTEGAYKHKNKALLGPMFRGYKEGYHDAQKNGQSASDFDVIRDKRVNPLVFRLYDSTKTGVASQTLNGFNLFKSPRIVFALGIAISAFVYATATGGYEILLGTRTTTQAQPIAPAPDPSVDLSSQAPVPVSVVPPVPVDDSDNRDVVPRPDRQAGSIDSGPLSGLRLWISGYVTAPNRIYYSLSVLVDGDPVEYLASDLRQMGYQFNGYGRCYGEIVYQGESYPVTCVPLVLRNDSLGPSGAVREGRNVEHTNAPPRTAL